MMAEVRDRFGGLDILVNNAGILRDRTVAKMTPDEWREVIDVNLTGVFLVCKFGLEVMRDGGCVVNLGQPLGRGGFRRPEQLRGGQGGRAGADARPQPRVRPPLDPGQRRRPRPDRHRDGRHDPRAGPRADGVADPPADGSGGPRRWRQAVLFLCSPLASYVTGRP